MRTQVLFEEKLVPVCRPDLLSDKDIVEQLNTLPRIHRRQNPEAWLHYAGQSGIVLDNPAQGVRYDLHEMAIAAVLAGQGVAMVPRIYVEKELNQGLLVAPWPDSEQLSKTFCLVKPVETGINEPALQDFERWLRAEPMLHRAHEGKRQVVNFFDF